MSRRSRYSRAESLDRAMDLFWSRGYLGTSMKDLEEGLDMRPGSIYAAFGSKEQLFLDALEWYATGMQEEIATLMGDRPLAEGLAAYFQALAKGTASIGVGRACLIVRSLLEAAETQPVIVQRAEAFLSQAESGFKELLEAASARGEIPPDIDGPRLARYLQSQIMGLRVILQRPGLSPVARLALADDMLAGFLAVVGKPGDT
ncbi:MAG TPA: TetR family transcriptional regulator [Alcanivorax sp.]|jgi:AcrR family transcriptional regulator|nr:TetR family transcriptional regulator [Alcanivorax sp.]HBL88035.1 TetR family transcriptional regulator [Alcanivorax sp.]HBM24600.1 TetR family transcriptional regulator [Alcanivorax sp.]HBP76604.1 TetR family transcriptional regulator [Alcanivorax sp.]HCI11170.1 TetR family transcriptional regulator [Alcanivorax sp.]